jgi:hypothetical protein
MRIAVSTASLNSSSSRVIARSAGSAPLTDLQRSTEIALDNLEERLKAGEKLLTESYRRPGCLNVPRLVRELGLPGDWLLHFFS